MNVKRNSALYAATMTHPVCHFLGRGSLTLTTPLVQKGLCDKNYF